MKACVNKIALHPFFVDHRHLDALLDTRVWISFLCFWGVFFFMFKGNINFLLLYVNLYSKRGVKFDTYHTMSRKLSEKNTVFLRYVPSALHAICRMQREYILLSSNKNLKPLTYNLITRGHHSFILKLNSKHYINA